MIRPIDLQTTLISTQQNAAAAQRAEQGPRADAQAAQAAFAAEITRRDESVAATARAMGNKVAAKPEDGKERKRRSAADGSRTPFEEVDETAESAEEPQHIVDFTA